MVSMLLIGQITKFFILGQNMWTLDIISFKTRQKKRLFHQSFSQQMVKLLIFSLNLQMCLGLNPLENPQVYAYSVDFLQNLSKTFSCVSLSPSCLSKLLNVTKLMFLLFWFNIFSNFHKFSTIAEFMRVTCLFVLFKIQIDS